MTAQWLAIAITIILALFSVAVSWGKNTGQILNLQDDLQELRDELKEFKKEVRADLESAMSKRDFEVRHSEVKESLKLIESKLWNKGIR